MIAQPSPFAQGGQPDARHAAGRCSAECRRRRRAAIMQAAPAQKTIVAGMAPQIVGGQMQRHAGHAAGDAGGMPGMPGHDAAGHAGRWLPAARLPPGGGPQKTVMLQPSEGVVSVARTGGALRRCPPAARPEPSSARRVDAVLDHVLVDRHRGRRARLRHRPAAVSMAPDDDDKRPRRSRTARTRPTTATARPRALVRLAVVRPSSPRQASRSRPARIPRSRSRSRKRRDAAIAAIDPALLDADPRAHRGRTRDACSSSSRRSTSTSTRTSRCSTRRWSTRAPIAEPREVEIPEELRDDLKDCTPQALLRDLHRARARLREDVRDRRRGRRAAARHRRRGRRRRCDELEAAAARRRRRAPRRAQLLAELRADRTAAVAGTVRCPPLPNRRVGELTRSPWANPTGRQPMTRAAS